MGQQSSTSWCPTECEDDQMDQAARTNCDNLKKNGYSISERLQPNLIQKSRHTGALSILILSYPTHNMELVGTYSILTWSAVNNIQSNFVDLLSEALIDGNYAHWVPT
eukprot:67928_1